MKKIQIKSTLGDLLFEYEAENNTIKKTLEEAVCRGVQLEDAWLEGVQLEDAQLQGAWLQGAWLQGAWLKDAWLEGVQLQDAQLQGAWLKNAWLKGAWLKGANFQGAYLQDANLQGANFQGANFQGAYLHGAQMQIFWRSHLSILKCQKTNLIAYKYLNKNFRSPYRKFLYEIGKTYKFECNPDIFTCRAEGGNIATLEWCLQETRGDIDDFIYVEVNFNPKDLVVPFCSDGRFRVSEFTITRKLEKKELMSMFECPKNKL